MAPPNNDNNELLVSNYRENGNARKNFNNSDDENYIFENGNFHRPKINRFYRIKKLLTWKLSPTPKSEELKSEIIWRNVVVYALLHMGGIYGSYRLVLSACFETVIFFFFCTTIVNFGVTAGTHRLWCHKSYKAKLPLRILLMIFQTMATQKSIYVWVRDHRVHHKFPDSNADPHNIKKGFFFAHIGWLMVKKHPDVLAKGKTIDMKDLEEDHVVMFQRKYYIYLVLTISFLIPYLVPIYCWGETRQNSFYIIIMFRLISSLNFTFSINSFAHILGMKPYDRNISPCNNPYTSLITGGEGWHNYHHIFPWDYKAAELGEYGLNWTLFGIDLFAKIGWAYDLKTISEVMIRKRIERTGDGSHKWSKLETPQERLAALINDPEFHNIEEPVWGWEDKDMNKDDIVDAHVLHKSK